MSFKCNMFNMFCSIGKLVTLLLKQIKSFVFNEKQSMTKFSSIFVILAPNPIVLERLMNIFMVYVV
jgi:hypothetical protein